MGQIYPTPASVGQSLSINTNSPLTGGGSVSLGGSLTLGLSTSNSSTRQAYVITPSPDGTTANFTIVGLPPGSNVSYADVFVGGKLQFVSAFTLSGSTLSLNTPPTTGQKVRVVCSTPSDNRQQYTLVSSSSTVFTFPSVTPQSTYVDIYDGNGKLQTIGTTGYYLDITNGAYSVVFASAPVTPVVAVFDPTANSGRNLYTTTAVTSTTFNISGGSPSTPYIDVFDQGLFLMDGSSYDYTLSYTSGSWAITFATAPVAPVAIFAPTVILPPSQSIGSVVNTLNTLSGNVTLGAGSNITLAPSGNNITIAVNLPTATTSSLGVMEVGTGLSVSAGVVTPTFGTATNQVAEGGVITASGPIGSASVVPVITYNAAGQLTTVTTATPAVSVVAGKALTGSGSAIPTGPTSSTSGDLVSFTGTSGQIADSGIAASNVPLLNAANAFTNAGTTTFQQGAGGLAFDATTQTIGTTFGSGGQLTLNAEGPTSTTGASVFLGGSTRGDANKNAITFSENNIEYARIDGNYTGHTPGNVGIGTTTPHSKLAVVGLPAYANNAAAISGGLAAGDFFRDGGDPDHVCVVH